MNAGGALSDGNTTRQAYHGDANIELRALIIKSLLVAYIIILITKTRQQVIQH